MAALDWQAAQFQSTLPAGEATRKGWCQYPPSPIFQSTLPAGEATFQGTSYNSTDIISIHASRGGSDESETKAVAGQSDFNPRFPRGKRPCSSMTYSNGLIFQSTLPAGEATGFLRGLCLHLFNFNPRFPRGKRPALSASAGKGIYFNPRFPRGKRLRGKAIP